MQENSTRQISAEQAALIDAAIAKAKAARAARTSSVGTDTTTDANAAPKKDKDAERQAKKEQRDRDRAERQAAREQKKLEKKQEREAQLAAKQPAHMSKVLKAAERLPQLDEQATAIFAQIEALPNDQKLALAEHIRLNVRLTATQQAIETSATFQVGQRVIVTGGDVKLVGMVGTLTSVRRIRCLVELPDAGKEAYLFLSDVALYTGDEPAEAVASEENEEEAVEESVAAPPADKDSDVEESSEEEEEDDQAAE